MSRFKSLIISTLTTAISMLGLAQTVYAKEVTPVGGVVTATSKLTIIAPYLVLAGIVAVASVVYIKRRKR